ncbi:MAG TPA: SigE family RNA polymerase sigma factor [Streptosporangiaceae bacterium]|nr:SigE family RNA polymerase sigma factor [Streptosporangiaceae bacterium]
MNAEEDEFALFVQARERALQRTAWMLTGDWALAEDLVQTALARSWLRWDRITRRDDPEIYVRRAMINTWLTWRRRSWRGEMASAELPDSAAPGDLAAEVAAREVVGQVLAKLTDKQRAVLVLRVVDDLSEAQVAQVLGCALGTVKSTMSQALAKLRGDSRLTELMEVERK